MCFANSVSEVKSSNTDRNSLIPTTREGGGLNPLLLASRCMEARAGIAYRAWTPSCHPNGNTTAQQYVLLRAPPPPGAMRRNWRMTFALQSRRPTLVHRGYPTDRSRRWHQDRIRGRRCHGRTGTPNHTDVIEFTAMRDPRNESRKIFMAYTNPRRHGTAEPIVEVTSLPTACSRNIENNVTRGYDGVM